MRPTRLHREPLRAGTRVAGVGGYRSSRVIGNAEVAGPIDSSDEWIRERSGIIERRWARCDETVVSMAAAAGTAALADAQVRADDVDLVIVATASHPQPIPNAAAAVAALMGTTSAAAHDLGAACAGFSYGIAHASASITVGQAENVLVIGAERLSDFTNPRDRGTAFLFADGAGAVLVTASDRPQIGAPAWGSDGSLGDSISMTSTIIESGLRGQPAPTIVMAGQTVFRWAVSEMARVARLALERAGITAADLGAFIPHQANQRITDALARSLDLPDHVAVADDIRRMGNTSAASIPLAMCALRDAGRVESEDWALLVGFGAGLTYSGQVVNIP